MILKKLILHNIASIEDAEIRFDEAPLNESEVFLIAGKTGAGKSTILDGISLALYADTPRFARASRGQDPTGRLELNTTDPRQILRRGAGEGFVKLVFTGNDDTSYEAEWRVRRSRNKPSGSFQNKEWRLCNLDTGHTFTRDDEIRREIDRAMKLDFNQFCRTTMLAQGEFAQFLNSKEGEKADILEKITGMDRYSRIGQKIAEIFKAKEQAWEKAREKARSLSLFSPEEQKTIEEEIGTLDRRFAELKSFTDKETKKRDWLKNSEKLTRTLGKAEADVAMARETVDSQDYKDKNRLIEEWRESAGPRLWLTQTVTARNELHKAQQTLDNLSDNYLGFLNALQWEEKALKETERKIKKLDEDLEQEKDFGLKELPELRNLLNDNIEFTFRITSAREKLKAFHSGIKKLEERKKEVDEAEKALSQSSLQEETLSPMLQQALGMGKTALGAYEALKDSVDKFAVAMRAQLHTGDTCPVCLRVIEQAFEAEENVVRRVKESKELLAEAEKNRKEIENRLNQARASIKAEKARLKSAKSLLLSEQTATQLLRSETESACNELRITGIDDDTAPELEKLLKKKTEEKRAIERIINKVAEKETLRLALRDMQKVISDATEAKRMILDKMPSWIELKGHTPCQEKNLSKMSAGLIESISATIERVSTLKEALVRNSNSLQEFLKQHTEYDEDKLNRLNGITEKEIKEASDRLTSIRNSLIQSGTRLEEARKQFEEHQNIKPDILPDETAENLQEGIEKAETEKQSNREQAGSLGRRLAEDQENRKRLKHLLEETEKCKKEVDSWARLNSLLGDAKGNKFKKIAQSYVLENLVDCANRYMATLSDRYTLRTTPGTLLISVEDAYQGYSLRAASTLSGGETFLVSLSLALGLSNISDNLGVDTIFIDEGFGSLSGESLQKAVATLRSLHSKMNKHVGIISHIEELRETIPVQILVEQEGNGASSRIEVRS